MTLREYIIHLEAIRANHGDSIEVMVQTIYHRFEAEPPVIRMKPGPVKTSWDEVPFVLLNP